MDSLRPGVLLKLLHDQDTSAAAARRLPALLQVTSIIPTLSGTGLFPDRGFFLRVSDSSHSTFVSLPQDHDDLILNDSLHLGQLIHVARLDPASPVPILRGVRILPVRLPCPTDTANLVAATCSTSDPTEPFLPPPPLPEGKKITFKARDNGGPRCRSIPTSPVNGAIKRRELEWGRSDVLSELAKISVTVVDEDSDDSDGSRFSHTSSSSSYSSSSCVLRPKALRKSWDTAGRISERRRDAKPIVRSRSQSASVSPNKLAQRSNFIPKDDTLANLLARRKDTEGTLKVLGSSSKKKFCTSNKSCIESSSIGIAFSSYNDIRWPENNVVWGSLPSSLVKCGKEVLRQRDSALNAAVDALQEAFASEKLIQSLSIYSELKSNMEADPEHLIERFLSFHHDFVQARSVTQSLAKPGSLRACSLSSAGSASTKAAMEVTLERKLCAASWIKAALESDLLQAPAPVAATTDSTEFPVADGKLLSFNTFIKRERKNNDLVPKASHVADALICDCNRWFLNYIEKFLDAVTDYTGCEPRIASLLCLLKRVDEWLDTISSKERAWGSDRCRETVSSEDEEGESCGRVRRKIYGVLLRHVESAAIALENMTATGEEEDQG